MQHACRGLVRHHRAASHPPRHLCSIRDLTTKIRAFIDGWNDHAHPFTWTKPPTRILAKANRQKISAVDH
jgi:hypothetical protein